MHELGRNVTPGAAAIPETTAPTGNACSPRLKSLSRAQRSNRGARMPP